MSSDFRHSPFVFSPNTHQDPPSLVETKDGGGEGVDVTMSGQTSYPLSTLEHFTPLVSSLSYDIESTGRPRRGGGLT